MPASKINGLTVAYTAVGGAVLWSGIAGTSLSTTFRDLLAGTKPSSSASEEPIAPAAAATAASGTAAAGNTGASSASAAANQAIAKILAAPYGWSTGTQWTDLVSLWNRESGWSATADTRKSGLDSADAAVFAYGIPQARPYSKMPKAAWPPDKGGSASATDQITWGLAYIKSAYGSPSAAWAEETSAGAY